MAERLERLKQVTLWAAYLILGLVALWCAVDKEVRVDTIELALFLLLIWLIKRLCPWEQMFERLGETIYSVCTFVAGALAVLGAGSLIFGNIGGVFALISAVIVFGIGRALLYVLADR
jgi:hypothetical protein